MSNFIDDYRSIYNQVEPDMNLISDTLARKRISTRHKKQRIRRLVLLPGTALAFLFIAFASMVNLSPTLALAFQQMPILDSLASVVYISPSMHAAAENDYIQHIGLEQTVEGVTMRIEHVILDKKQLNIFVDARLLLLLSIMSDFVVCVFIVCIFIECYFIGCVIIVRRIID